MKIEPIRHYAQPQLPTREIVNEHPEILRLLPKRWQGNAAVVAALTACLVMTNCRGSKADDAPSRVAPIFTHGDGIGAFGCKAINPPVFLSEDEARQVVVEEAKRAGIRFTPDGKTLEKINLPVNGTMEAVTDAQGNTKYQIKKGTQVESIALDGLDKKRNIGYEFVSGQDLRDWKSGTTEHGTAGSYDVIGTAKALRDGIAKTSPGGTYGVFYDPAIGWNDAQKNAGKLDYSSSDWQARVAKINASANQMAREELRKQVQDFIKWLKAQGVI